MARAQASMEYLLVAGIVLLVILPSIYIFYNYSHRSNVEIGQSQVDNIGKKIVDAAEEVYYLGGQSKITLDLTMPEGVKNMEIWCNQKLVFLMEDGSELSFNSRVNITSDEYLGGPKVCYGFKEASYSQGLKKVIVSAKMDNVLVEVR
ncbi:MAG: hypothetical protein PHV16_01185 [Candidatus Nanoarchaeia archaeon]|nr:hypothetical protein [Candidatus Nanoarchaeia archaeon]